MNRRGIAVIIQRVLADGPFSMNDLARESGLSYDALRSWAAGRRTPKPESLEKLAAYLDRHGRRLQDFAADLRASGEDSA